MFIYNGVKKLNLDFYSIITILICMAIGQLLYLLTKTLAVPLWLDLTGVIVAAALGGLVPGLITAVLNQLVMSLVYYDFSHMLYIIPALVIIFSINVFLKARSKGILSLAGVFFISLIIYSLLSAFISIALYGGFSGYAPVDKLFYSFISNPDISLFFSSFTSWLYISFFDLFASFLLSFIFYIILDRYTPFNFK